MVALNRPAGSSLDIISHTRSSLVLWSTIILLAGPVVPQGSPSCMSQFKWVSNFFSRKRSLLSSVSGDSDEQQFEPKPMRDHKAFVGTMLSWFFHRSALALLTLISEDVDECVSGRSHYSSCLPNTTVQREQSRPLWNAMHVQFGRLPDIFRVRILPTE